MKLHRMTATFGCLSQATLELSDGLNVLYAPNESGKSTWCAFLVIMLYGLNTKSRDKKGAPAEKNRYRPWSGAPMEGLLDFTHEGRRILLRRTSEHGTPMGTFSAHYADTDEAVPNLSAETAGEVLTGVSREVFERSLLLRQSQLAVDQNHDLEERIAALLSSGDEQVSWSETDAKLRQWQRSRKYNKTGQLVQKQQEEQTLLTQLSQLSTLWQEQLFLEDSISQLTQTLDQQNRTDLSITKEQTDALNLQWAQAAAELDAAQLAIGALPEQDLYEVEKRKRARIQAIASLEHGKRKRGLRTFLLSVLSLIVAAVLLASAYVPTLPQLGPLTLPFPVLLVLLVLLGLCLLGLNVHRLRANKQISHEIAHLQKQEQEDAAHLQKQEAEREAALSRQRAAKQLFDVLASQLERSTYRSTDSVELEQTLSQKKERLALLRGRLQELGDPIGLEAELEANRETQARLRLEYDALTEAISVLGEAEKELRSRFSPKLNTRTSQYFSLLTGGTYDSVLLDRDFSANVEEADSLALRSALYFSQGTADQLYFALRLALCDLVLPHANEVPLILDDALASFDDERAALALDLLLERSKKRQILLFSCHARIGQMLTQAHGVSYPQLVKS